MRPVGVWKSTLPCAASSRPTPPCPSRLSISSMTSHDSATERMPRSYARTTTPSDEPARIRSITACNPGRLTSSPADTFLVEVLALDVPLAGDPRPAVLQLGLG